MMSITLRAASGAGRNLAQLAEYRPAVTQPPADLKRRPYKKTTQGLRPVSSTRRLTLVCWLRSRPMPAFKDLKTRAESAGRRSVMWQACGQPSATTSEQAHRSCFANTHYYCLGRGHLARFSYGWVVRARSPLNSGDIGKFLPCRKTLSSLLQLHVQKAACAMAHCMHEPWSMHPGYFIHFAVDDLTIVKEKI